MCAMASILVLRGIFQVNIPRFGNVLFSGYLLLCIGKPKEGVKEREGQVPSSEAALWRVGLVAEDEALPEGDTGEGVPSFSNSRTNR